MNLQDLTEKARAIEFDHKHRFSQSPHRTSSLFPSPRKDRSSGVWFYPCLDCGRQLYLVDGQVLGTAIDGGRCEV